MLFGVGIQLLLEKLPGPRLNIIVGFGMRISNPSIDSFNKKLLQTAIEIVDKRKQGSHDRSNNILPSSELIDNNLSHSY